ncbi:MAG: family 10 glycosylhydrolase [Flavitalea sp.]
MKQLLLVSLAFIAFSIISVAQPKYEFRAAWIATVDNIDWPTRGNYNTESQKQEFIKMLDMHQRNGMNAVIAQIRPCTDAFYPSALEPWSEWLTGKQGKAPFPYYDPLQFMIEETHKRGMEFHAWCNPYRAEFNIGKSSIAPDHITKKRPEWFLSYGGKKYFDPGNKDAQQFVVSVIRDVVSRYEVDAIHFDDYFYPYRVPGKEFPDQDSYAKSGTTLSKDDWRRANVDSIIVHLNKAIKEENPTCRFGISPFGVWRNKDKDAEGSNTKAGVTNYDDLYADILLWLKQGWIDYVAPQIYWEIGHPAAPFEVLVDWWSKHTYGKHCYIGLAIYRAGSNNAWKDKTQLPRMLTAMRSYPEIQGAIYFSSRSFEKNPNGWNDSLQNNYYKYPAVIPAMEWLDTVKPEKPIVVKVAGESLSNVFVLDIKKHITSGPIKGYVVYAFNSNDQVRDTEDPKNILQISYTSSASTVMLSTASMKDKILAVSTLDINNNESELLLVP